MKQPGTVEEQKFAPGNRERWVWGALALLSALPVALLSVAASAGRLSLGDRAVVEWMLSNRWPALDWVMLLVSWLSSEYGTPVLLMALLVILWKRERTAVVSAVAVIASSTLWQIWLKALIGRPRPEPVLYPAWQGAGFPSGHALTVLVAAYIIWKLAPALRLSRQAAAGLGWAALFWVLLVGASRIYLNAHFLSDVIGGYLLGVWHLGLAFTVLGTRWLSLKTSKTVS